MVTEQILTGSLLVLSSIVFTFGGILYTGRAIWKLPAGETSTYLRWERGLVIGAVLTVLTGLTLLERILEAAGDRILAPAGMVLFIVAVPIVIFAETYFVARQEWLLPPIVVFVVLAFLGEAIFGASILRTGLLSAWVGWVAILWNLGCLVVLPIIRPKEMYYPWLHYVAPLLIGIDLILMA